MRYTILSNLLWLPVCLALPGQERLDVQPRLPYELSKDTLHVRGNSSNGSGVLADATPSQLERARQIVNAAIEEAGKRNAARLAHPMRNTYMLHPKTGGLARRKRGAAPVVDLTPPPPLLDLTDEIRAAAALVAEAEAKNETRLATRPAAATAQGKWWMGNLKHSGGWPWGKNKDDYKVCACSTIMVGSSTTDCVVLGLP